MSSPSKSPYSSSDLHRVTRERRWREIIATYHGAVSGWFARVPCSREERATLIQSVFSDAFLSEDLPDAAQDLWPWLRLFCRRVSADWKRNMSHEIPMGDCHAVRQQEEFDPFRNRREAVWQSEQALLRQLSPCQRSAVERWMDGGLHLTGSDLPELRDSTARVHKHRALVKLRALVDEAKEARAEDVPNPESGRGGQNGC